MVRVASCSVRGLPDTYSDRRNARRCHLLGEIVESLREDAPVDALVLPGGYFVEGRPNVYLDKSFEERCKLQKAASFAEDVLCAAEALDRQRAGALLIFGVDTGKKGKDPQGDQLCVAWSARGPVGIGRKVFPTEWEGCNGLVVNVDDFAAQDRLVPVGDHLVLLCACYDGYGVANSPDKSKYIREIVSGGKRLTRGGGGTAKVFRQELKNGLADWARLVERATAAAIAIHRFGGDGQPFSTSYWRRHGIATASARLGGWAVAGANFDVRLPHPGVDVLAAHRVPYDQIAEGQLRTTWDAVPVRDYVVGGCEVRIRVFDFA